MKKFLFVLLFYFHSQFTFGQKTNFTVIEIDSIIKHINLTCISGGITDYIFHKKGHKKKVIGGGADWYYVDTSRTKLLKAIRETSIESENIDIYYFFQDSLIYLKTSNGTYIDGKKKINWEGEYYFQNDTLIFKKDDLKFTFNPNRYLKIARQFFSAGQIWRR